MRWETLKFGPKNHWEATTIITVGGESAECEESGRWTAEKADSDSKGTVMLKTKKSSCAGRSDSTEYRLGLTVQDNGWQVVVRLVGFALWAMLGCRVEGVTPPPAGGASHTGIEGGNGSGACPGAVDADADGWHAASSGGTIATTTTIGSTVVSMAKTSAPSR